MNLLIIVGNITHDPEHKVINDISRCSFTVAVNRRYAGKDGKRESDFIPCVAWRGTADFIHKHFIKGNRIGITGSLQSRTYEAQDGSKRTVYECVVDSAEFVAPKHDSGEPAAPRQETDEFVEVTDEQLPF